MPGDCMQKKENPMNKLFAGMMLLALGSLASAAPETPTKTGDTAANKQMEQKRSRSKGQAHTGGSHKAKKEPKVQTGTVSPVK